MKKRLFTFALMLILVITCFSFPSSAVNLQLPSLWREYEDYFMMGNFGQYSGNQQNYHFISSSPSNNMKLDGQIGNSNTNSLSRQNYNSVKTELDGQLASGTITQAEYDAALEAANTDVQLAANTQAMNYVQGARTLNATLPENEHKKIRGHVMVWHGGQQPMYFFCNGFVYNAQNPDWASPETMLKRLDIYIMKLTEKFAPYDDVIYSWDVVNEAVDDYTGQIRNMDDPLTQSGQWGNIFRRKDLDDKPEERLYEESVFVRQAFASARKWAEHYEADWTLYYNDFQDSNKPYEPKMSQSVKMLKPIYEAGNIDGYGMQGRLSSVNPNMELLRQQFELGLTVADELAFTETDIRSDFMLNPDYDPTLPSTPNGDSAEMNTYDVDNSPVKRKDGWGRLNTGGWNANAANTMAMREDIQREQADYAADLMDLLIEYKDVFVVCHWDGTNDQSTFNRSKGAHLWSGLQGNVEKMSYFAVIGAPNRDKLKNAIASGPSDKDKNLYGLGPWNAYKAAVANGEELLETRIYDMAGVTAVKDAIVEVEEAIAALIPKTTVQENSEYLNFAGNWGRRAQIGKFSEHIAMQTSKVGDSVTFKFNGSYFEIMSYKSYSQGTMDIYVDGVKTGSEDLYQLGSDGAFQAVVGETEVAPGEHTVTIVASGRNESSIGNNVYIDTVSVVGEFLPLGGGESLSDDIAIVQQVDTATVIDALANDVTAQTDPIPEITGQPSSGEVTFEDGVFLFTPTKIGIEDDSFTYKIGEATATVTLNYANSIRYEEDFPAVVKTGSWQRFEFARYSGGSALRSGVNDDTITVKFYGSGIDIIGYKSWSRGIVDITVDGTTTTVDTFDMTYDQTYNQSIYTVTGLTQGAEHTLTIRVTGDRFVLASGNAIDIDAFVVHK